MRALRDCALAMLAVATLPVALFASPAAPTHPGRRPPPPAPHAPTTWQHSEFVVETNRLGQVTRATKVVRSNDSAFNAMTYGNALQAYIRTPDGRAIAGTYKLTYDYNPKNKNVHRGVALLRMGGVNPNAKGAVVVEAEKLEAEHAHVQAAQAEASALPNLHQMTRHHH